MSGKRLTTVCTFLALCMSMMLLMACGGGGHSTNISKFSPSHLSVNPATASVALGKKQQLKAVLFYTDGSSKDVTTATTWSASPSTVGTISGGGMFNSKAQGSSTISATFKGFQGSGTIQVGPATVQALQVSPATASIPNGTSAAFTNMAVYSDGTKKDVTASTMWHTSNSSVATVDSTGKAHAVAPGTTQILASYNSVSGSASLTVSAASVKSIQVSPAIAVFAKGTDIQLSATSTLTDGSTQTVTGSATWTATPSSACTVNANGKVHGSGIGICTVSAAIGGHSGASVLTVSPATLTSISVSPLNITVAVGGVLQLNAIGHFSDATTQDLTASLTYSSSAAGVATVSASGLLKGISTGTATVTASLGGVSQAFNVTVSAATLTSVTLDADNVSIAAGISSQIKATGHFSDGSTLDLTASATWSSSSTSVAAIDATGKVTGVAAGTATITGNVNGVSGTLLMTITPASVVSISVNPTTLTLALGQTQAMVAIASFSDGSTLDVTGSVHWSVGNPLLASVSNQTGTTGLISTLAAGTTEVTATLGSTSGSATLYVNAASLVSVNITPGNLSLALGVPGLLTATGTYSDGSTLDITSSVQWSCSNGALSVSAAGVVTPLSLGSATVTATSGSVNATASVSVTNAVLQTIDLSPVLSLSAGLSAQVSATGHYSDGSTADITSVVHWTSSNPSIFTVSATGTLNALSAGTASVTASLAGCTKTISVSVSTAVLQSLTVSAPQNTLALGFNLQLTATGHYSDGSTQDLTATVTWSTSNSLVANVSGSGQVSGLAAGSITATASFQGVSSGASITITPATLVSISISPSTVTLANLLQTKQFTVTGTFSDGSTQVLSAGAHWSCSNGLLASINANGLLVALGLGDVSVNVSYAGLNATATVHIL